ncbi:MAG: hypothetical protein HY880_09190 [Deltaproteobacteria bacterium]|nr:hypothetical protein [Deltaproteobacteria bacterium]
MNEVFIEQKKIDGSFYPRISEQAIKKAISNKENLLCREIFSAYRVLYPNAGAVCKACVPELPLVFNRSVLHRVFTRKGKKASTYTDYWDFRDLLTEMGIVGKVIVETDRYFVGKFEYTEPHKLVVSDDDILCLHPVFAEVFSFKRSGTIKTVYPYGCDPETPDHRTWVN